MAYDLFIQAPHGSLLPTDERKRLFASFLLETKLDERCEITEFGEGKLRGSFRSLQRYFAEGTFQKEEFEAFCESNSFVPGPSEREADAAAEAFTDLKWGQSLFAPKMPHENDEAKEAYRLIVDFARRHSLVLHDPQVGEDIDLKNPGDFPPMWGPVAKPESNPPKRRWFSWWK